MTNIKPNKPYFPKMLFQRENCMYPNMLRTFSAFGEEEKDPYAATVEHLMATGVDRASAEAYAAIQKEYDTAYDTANREYADTTTAIMENHTDEGQGEMYLAIADAHQKLMDAYHAAEEKAERDLAALSASSGIPIKSPFEENNRQVVYDIIQKAYLATDLCWEVDAEMGLLPKGPFGDEETLPAWIKKTFTYDADLSGIETVYPENKKLIMEKLDKMTAHVIGRCRNTENDTESSIYSIVYDMIELIPVSCVYEILTEFLMTHPLAKMSILPAMQNLAKGKDLQGAKPKTNAGIFGFFLKDSIPEDGRDICLSFEDIGIENLRSTRKVPYVKEKTTAIVERLYKGDISPEALAADGLSHMAPYIMTIRNSYMSYSWKLSVDNLSTSQARTLASFFDGKPYAIRGTVRDLSNASRQGEPVVPARVTLLFGTNENTRKADIWLYRAATIDEQ